MYHGSVASVFRPTGEGGDGVANIEILVFSAPKYCDSTENKGAYINIDSAYELDFEQFDAVPHPDIKPMVCPLSSTISSQYRVETQY